MPGWKLNTSISDTRMKGSCANKQPQVLQKTEECTLMPVVGSKTIIRPRNSFFFGGSKLFLPS